jgi:peptidyl-tRNA hydrolase
VHAVLDAGRTEVAPGSFTVLGLGGALASGGWSAQAAVAHARF